MVELALPHATLAGEWVHVSMLRPRAWLEAWGALQPGDQVRFETDELEHAGWATVLSLRGPPPVEEGPGRLVLTTYTYVSDDVRELRFVGETETLRATGAHRFYSVDRDAWVSARDLWLGERVQTALGAIEVASVDSISGRERVYNLEVEGEHEYLVSDLGVRSHNSGVKSCGGVAEQPGLPQDGTWSGVPGESDFTPRRSSRLPHPDDPDVVDLPPGESIPFRGGEPDFSRVAWDEFEVPGLTGNVRGAGMRDSTRMELAVAERYGLVGASGRATAAAGRKYLRRLGLVAHHAGGPKVQLLGHGLHGQTRVRVGVPHRGGATKLRSQQ